jgi:hypothetical protein
MCRPRCDMGVRAGERVTAELFWRGGGVIGRIGEDEDPGNGDEGKGGGNNSLGVLDGSDGPAFGDDGHAEDVLAKTREKSS